MKLPRRRGELLFGLAPCLAALQAARRRVYSVVLQKGFMEGAFEKELKLLVSENVKRYVSSHGTKLYRVDKEALEGLIGKKPSHQGILMDVEPLRFKPMTLDSNLLNHKQFPKVHLLWLLLYHVQDPMNFGAIIRSAYFFGVDRILVTNKRFLLLWNEPFIKQHVHQISSCPLSPVVSKSSAGAMELLSIHSISDINPLLKVAADKGWDILGTVSPDKFEHFSVVSASRHKISRPTILIVGNEGHGLTKEVCSCCTKLLTINPNRSLSPGFDSLNVSVATGILLSTLYSNKI